jgi:hypothetical protein
MRAAALALCCFAFAACHRKSDAERVADRFADLYYVEIDQRAALDITVGPAHDALVAELKEVGQARGVGEGERPRTYYSRRSSEEHDGFAHVVYDLETKLGGSAVKRTATVSLAKRDGHWKVISFGQTEGAAPEHP